MMPPARTAIEAETDGRRTERLASSGRMTRCTAPHPDGRLCPICALLIFPRLSAAADRRLNSRGGPMAVGSRLAVLFSAALAFVGVSSVLTARPAAAQGTVSVACGSVGAEFDLCKTGAEAWSTKTGNKVKVVSVPKDSNEQLALFQQLLSQKSGEIDVIRIDVVWPGLLAQHLVDLSKEVPKDVIAQHFPAIIEANTVGGKLVALPAFTDAGLLYYRKDLTETAKIVQDGERKAGNDKLYGIVFQGRAYEGLTCNGLEWVDSFGGGTIVDGKGKVTINNPKAVAAVK